MEYGLIGKNITYSYSQKIHMMLSGNSYELLSFPNESDVHQFLKQDFKGINVTIPYKTLVYKNVDILSKQAKDTQTVNTVINKNGTLYGYNTDVDGFDYLLTKNKIKIADKKCLILGTGATSRTIKFVLENRGAKSVKFLSRNPSENNQYSYNEKSVISESEIIVNTTPVGTYPNINESLIDFNDCLSLDTFIDVVYNPYNSKMVLEARDYGHKAVGGLDMLIGQAVKSNELFNEMQHSLSKYSEIRTFLAKSVLNLVFIGHPFAGKTALSQEFNKYFNAKFVDIDQEIIKHENGKSIESIFNEKGEAYFRQIESKIIKEYSSKVGYIISLGGGAILNKENLNVIRPNSIIFNVKRDVKSINENEIKNRPLCKCKNDLLKLIENRKEIYAKYADFEIDNSGSLENSIKQIWRCLWRYS